MALMSLSSKNIVLTALAALLIALVVSSISAQRADAASRIRAGQCDVYATNLVDPIAFSSHLHAQIMNTSTSNTSTGESLKTAASTSCQAEDNWATSGGWYPQTQELSKRSDKATVYYRDPGNLRVEPIPTGLKMLTKTKVFKGDLMTVRFPNCVAVDGIGRPVLDSSDHMSHLRDAGMNACPSSHPYRIPQVSYLIHWGGSVKSSTPISIGSGQWGPAGTNMHADYFAAVQDEFNFATEEGKALIDLCLNDVPLNVDMASSRCGVGA